MTINQAESPKALSMKRFGFSKVKLICFFYFLLNQHFNYILIIKAAFYFMSYSMWVYIYYFIIGV